MAKSAAFVAITGDAVQTLAAAVARQLETRAPSWMVLRLERAGADVVDLVDLDRHAIAQRLLAGAALDLRR